MSESDTAETMAKGYTKTAIEQLVHIATRSKSDNARLLACREILDRGWGKPGAMPEEPKPPPPTPTSPQWDGPPIRLADFRTQP
jgi:hypothetical protein